MDAKAVAAMLGVRPKRVYELDIEHVRIGERTIRWLRSDVEDWVQTRRSRP
jgi:predicted DNA-binding transcriptional regulator AlpA